MNEIHKHDWGEALIVADTAPEEVRRGEICSVCGIRELNEQVIYLVEFCDGSSIEILEKYLRKINAHM